MSDLHSRLVALQPEWELRRKAQKAQSRVNYWTQEELDLALRQAERFGEELAEISE